LKKLSLQEKKENLNESDWKTSDTMLKYRSQIIPYPNEPNGVGQNQDQDQSVTGSIRDGPSIVSRVNQALLISGLKGRNFVECGTLIEAELEKAQLGKENIVSVQLFLRDLRKVVT